MSLSSGVKPYAKSYGAPLHAVPSDRKPAEKKINVTNYDEKITTEAYASNGADGPKAGAAAGADWKAKVNGYDMTGSLGASAKANCNAKDGVGAMAEVKSTTTFEGVPLEGSAKLGANVSKEKTEVAAIGKVGVAGIDASVGGAATVYTGEDGKYGAKVEGKVGPVSCSPSVIVTDKPGEKSVEAKVEVGLGKKLNAEVGVTAGKSEERGEFVDASVKIKGVEVGVGYSTKEGVTATIPGVGKVSSSQISNAVSTAAEKVSNAASAVGQKISSAWKRLWK